MTARHTVRSVCPHDCPDTCGLIVDVEGGHVTSVRGDPDHPFTRGLLCGKVARYAERVHSPLRVRHPLRRSGAKGSGEFERISWDEALDEVVRRFAEHSRRFGAATILPYSYGGTMGVIQRHAGHALFHKLGASRLLRTICSSSAQAGFAASLGPMVSTDIEQTVHSDLIVIWGSNTISTNLHAWHFFKEARRRGATLVVIDPYRNRTARQADRHLKLLPGTDAALALGLMHVLIREELVDREFIAQHTVGFEPLTERARDYPPQRVAELTGVAAADIERLARDYGRARAPYIRAGLGFTRQLRGGMAMRTVALLPALVGATHKRGGGITLATSLRQALDLELLTREDLSPPGTRSLNMIQLGDALTRVSDPPVTALYVYHSNPAVVAPDSGKVLAGLAREDLFTVVHDPLLTETALYADLVLPATTCLEHTDLYLSYGHYYIQMARPAIPPVGESRPNLAVFQEIAARLGFDDDCFADDEETLISRLLPGDSPWFRGITPERLSEGRPLRLNVPENPFAAGFATTSGKVELYSQRLADRGMDPLPDGTPSVDPDGEGRYPLQLITPPHHAFLNSSFNEIPRMRESAGPATLMIHPDDAAFRDIQDGELVRVFNDRGDCLLHARVTDEVSPGVTAAESLYWSRFMPGGRGINHLTSQRPIDLGGSAAFHCNLVDVESSGPSQAHT